ncbi:ABC transporter permease [Streptomyces sp. NPDC052676]|uniref:ABC transporter permease n=1 Tax=Streptomyces sp. NPDC052676 TaxID=3154953 RepID=UPI003445135B
MTAATATTTATTGTAPRGPRGLTWLVLRLHRSALWFWTMLLAVSAGALLWAYGPGADAAREEFRRMDCGPTGTPSLSCDYAGPAYQNYDLALALGAGLLTVAPLLVAAWAGGALTGRELEHGTARLAWVQSVSPARWLTAKLAVPAVVLTTGALALTALHRLVWASDGELRDGWREWHDPTPYVANGPLLIAYLLLGLAVGVLAGLLLGRALPALAVAALTQTALLTALTAARPHLWPAETLVDKEQYPDWIGMVVGDGALTADGARIDDPICVDDARCLAEHEVVGFYRDYHPSGHFWPLQLMETGIVLAVAALAVLAAFRLLRRRTGAAV